jgi:hypothetical protein
MWTPFLSVFNSNLFAGMLCGFFGVKRKLFWLSSAFKLFLSFPFFPHQGFPFHGSETSENIPFRVQNHCQSIWVTVTSRMKLWSTKTIAIASPQNLEILSPELCEYLRKVWDAPRIERLNGWMLPRNHWRWSSRMIRSGWDELRGFVDHSRGSRRSILGWSDSWSSHQFVFSEWTFLKMIIGQIFSLQCLTKSEWLRGESSIF